MKIKKLIKMAYIEENFLGRTIKVFLENKGWVTNYTGKKIYSYPSDAIIDAIKMVNKTRLK